MRPIDEYVGHRIRARRHELGLSAQAVANALGIHLQQIQRYESGRVRVSAERLWGVAKALGVRIDYFFYGYEEGSENSGFDAADPAGDSAGFESDAIPIQLLRGFATLQEREKKAVLFLVRSMTEKDQSTYEE